MFRWIRIAAIGAVALAMIGIGIAAGLVLVANSRWVLIQVPEWLQWAYGRDAVEVWLPALLGGWLASGLAAAVMLLWSMFYVWRRRQYESLIGRLERELAALRNLPFRRPAPLEDLPETRDDEGARLAAAAAEIDDELAGERPDDAEP